MPNYIQSFLLFAIINGVKFSPIASFQISPLNFAQKKDTSTTLNGKLWDKLEIDPDPLDEEPGWYLMNCIVGNEMNLLGQAKHVTRDTPSELVEKLVVPTERKLRSHGKTRTVVEVQVMYPGYVFCKMRICAETYEPLQNLPLCRSWMAGTVNQKGYKKLPPAPIALSDEEVAKFKGLEEQTAKMYEKFGEDYTGKGDDGDDLIDQYEGYKVESMVKILEGNFKGEDGVVRRLKDGQIMVRLYTYGNVLDQWFKPNEIRSMSDAEAMKGLTGPTSPISQDDFDTSIGNPRSRDTGGRGLRSNLMGGMGGGDRNRREDRVNRGERGKKDSLGRSEQEMKEEEQNWRQFREEQRASQQQKRGDMWGIKERTSWDSGDDAAQFEDGKWKSGREVRREKKQQPSGKRESQSVQDAVDGAGDWDLFADSSNDDNGGQEAEDDFFNSLMSELSDSLETPSKNNNNKKQEKPPPAQPNDSSNNEDDFFTDLMSQLSESVDENPVGKHDDAKPTSDGAFSDDDFFASLEADLNESLSADSPQEKMSASDESGFFADLGDKLEETPRNNIDAITGMNEDDFFASLESQLDEVLVDKKPAPQPIDDSQTVAKTPKNGKTKQKSGKDLSQHTVPVLKVMLKERGLKVSGKKSELIARLEGEV